MRSVVFFSVGDGYQNAVFGSVSVGLTVWRENGKFEAGISLGIQRWVRGRGREVVGFFCWENFSSNYECI